MEGLDVAMQALSEYAAAVQAVKATINEAFQRTPAGSPLVVLVQPTPQQLMILRSAFAAHPQWSLESLASATLGPVCWALVKK
jgi:hypothetical protein